MIKASTVLGTLLIIGCTGTQKEESSASEVNSTYEIASDDYSYLADKALNLLASFDFDSWGELLAEDIEYYFPDGDAGTRTVLTGKQAVVGWYKSWKENSGIEKMTYSNSVHIPIIAKETLNYTGLTGPFVISYFSNEMVYNGIPVSIRMNFAVHFNDDRLIDRYYAYYDRTPIINTVSTNILKPETEKEE